MTSNKAMDVEPTNSDITPAPGTCSSGWAACWKQRTLPEKILLSLIAVIFIG